MEIHPFLTSMIMGGSVTGKTSAHHRNSDAFHRTEPETGYRKPEPMSRQVTVHMAPGDLVPVHPPSERERRVVRWVKFVKVGCLSVGWPVGSKKCVYSG